MFGNWVRNTSTNRNKPPAGLSWLQTGHRGVHTVLSQSHKPFRIEAASASSCDLPRTSHRDHLSLKKKKNKINPSSRHYIPQNPRHPSCSSALNWNTCSKVVLPSADFRSKEEGQAGSQHILQLPGCRGCSQQLWLTWICCLVVPAS